MKMKKILLCIYPDKEITDINLEIIRQRMKLVQGWKPRLRDARVSDAFFVNVKLQLPSIGVNEIRRLREVFNKMPHMKTLVWRDDYTEVPLDKIDKKILEEAAVAFGRI